jgi:hypothetical protein
MTALRAAMHLRVRSEVSCRDGETTRSHTTTVLKLAIPAALRRGGLPVPDRSNDRRPAFVKPTPARVPVRSEVSSRAVASVVR